MQPNDKVSKYFTYREVIHSDNAERNGIPNIPNEQQLEKIKIMLANTSDKIREHFGVPVRLNSCFRSPELNAITSGASKTSQHMEGEAADNVIFGRNKEVFKFIRDNLDFDQLIWEYGTTDEPAWVHCSYVNYRKNRKQILRYYLENGKMKGVTFDLKID